MPNPIYVHDQDGDLFSVGYYDAENEARREALEAAWRRFNRQDPASGQTFRIWYRPTSPTMDVWVDHLMPPSAPAGRYRVETFIPGRHATSRQAIFTVAHNFREVNGQPVHDEPVAVVDMFDLYDVWHPLGEFDLDPGQDPLSGRVRQYDLSLEDPPADVSFGPIRWVPLFAVPDGGGKFDSPVGESWERKGPFPTGRMAFNKYPIWTGEWFDINPFLNWYFNGYHTGADLNLPGASGADQGKPIYAAGDGQVIWAGRAGGWGYIVVIEHPDALVSRPDGTVGRQMVYTRYGHVEKAIPVRRGETVRRGEHIANIGLPENQTTGWHLHFDVCYSGLLKSRPAHWPSKGRIQNLISSGVSRSSQAFKDAQAKMKKEVLDNYVDPLRFIRENHG